MSVGIASITVRRFHRETMEVVGARSVWIGEFKRSVDKDGKKCKGRVVCQRGEHGPFHCARIQAEESLPNAHAARI